MKQLDDRWELILWVLTLIGFIFFFREELMLKPSDSVSNTDAVAEVQADDPLAIPNRPGIAVMINGKVEVLSNFEDVQLSH